MSNTEVEYNDNSLMPFGTYKDYKLANVPAGVLLFLLEKNIARGGLKKYIEDNKQVLETEVKRASKNAAR